MHRREFLKKTMLSSVGIGILGGFYAWQIEPFSVEFMTKKIFLNKLNPVLIGKKLMQISDLHIGNRFDFGYIIESFKIAQKLNPDFVIYTGDYITYENEKQFDQLNEVLKYAPSGTLGTLAILGNHDYGKNWAEVEVATKVQSILENNNIRVLRNQNQSIQGLNFIGFDDLWGPNFNPTQAIDLYDSQNSNIALCHNPDTCDLELWNNFEGYILSGHTHGGQVKPPFLKPPLLPVKNKIYTSGEFKINSKTNLYINRAIGHLWQIRFNVRPEITIFELMKKDNTLIG